MNKLLYNKTNILRSISAQPIDEIINAEILQSRREPGEMSRCRFFSTDENKNIVKSKNINTKIENR